MKTRYSTTTLRNAKAFDLIKIRDRLEYGFRKYGLDDSREEQEDHAWTDKILQEKALINKKAFFENRKKEQENA